MSKIRILIVEDEWVIAEDIASMLRRLGYEVAGIAKNYTTAIEKLETTEIDIALLDIVLAGSKDGVEIGKVIKEKYDLPFIFITSHTDEATVKRAADIEPNGYLVKPFNRKDIYAAIEVALTNYSKAKKTKGNTESTENIFMKDSFFIKEEHLYIKVKFDDILWFSDGLSVSV